MFLNRFVFLIKGRRQYESIILGIKMLFEKKNCLTLILEGCLGGYNENQGEINKTNVHYLRALCFSEQYGDLRGRIRDKLFFLKGWLCFHNMTIRGTRSSYLTLKCNKEETQVALKTKITCTERIISIDFWCFLLKNDCRIFTRTHT